MAPPHDAIVDIIPDMLPEYVPVIVWPSSDIWAWPSADMEQGIIIPLKPPFATLMRKVTVDPLIVPVIVPIPVIDLTGSERFIVALMALAFWVTVHFNVS